MAWRTRCSKEHLVAMLDGGPVLRVRTVKRRMLSERWSAVNIKGIRATPRVPNPKDVGQERPMHEAGTKGIPLGMDTVGSMVPEVKAEGKKHALRDFKITKSILSRHGYTDDCQGCVASVLDTSASTMIHVGHVLKPC